MKKNWEMKRKNYFLRILEGQNIFYSKLVYFYLQNILEDFFSFFWSSEFNFTSAAIPARGGAKSFLCKENLAGLIRNLPSFITLGTKYLFLDSQMNI